jgi:class 3 adenylate cyclase
MSDTGPTRQDSSERRDHTVASGPPTSEGARRQITVLFSDMVGSTHLAEKLGDEAVYQLTRRLVGEQVATIETHGGSIQEFSGDGLMAVFGAPAALEDAPLRACQAAISIRSRLAALHDEIEAKFKACPQFRIGIHSGVAVVGKIGEGGVLSYSAIGDTVNVASRIQSAAAPGTVVVSAVTHELVSPFVESTSLGEIEIKGKSKPELLYRIDGIKLGVRRFEAARHRGLTVLIGREREI